MTKHENQPHPGHHGHTQGQPHRSAKNRKHPNQDRTPYHSKSGEPVTIPHYTETEHPHTVLTIVIGIRNSTSDHGVILVFCFFRSSRRRKSDKRPSETSINTCVLGDKTPKQKGPGNWKRNSRRPSPDTTTRVQATSEPRQDLLRATS